MSLGLNPQVKTRQPRDLIEPLVAWFIAGTMTSLYYTRGIKQNSPRFFENIIIFFKLHLKSKQMMTFSKKFIVVSLVSISSSFDG